ncbi:uncharacterized protein DDB_G0283357 isoform X4 [Hermetia illucens]|uniref:uncharacterized protein DDB_G0283357 isoform X4 n=1 Tax=Hermetia illucens TaxID=343691 RepID=UPI0018CC14E3|nr:uncharacterized protein DDB_G0283357 isoform X4 [Hermetia illucens]
MARLTEEMVIARSRQSDLGSIKKLNCWGSDLSDVSIIRRMRGVEVLALSVNKITSLADFEDCRNLQELYLRKNNIQDINEIAYLQALPKLKYLWLEENPCCDSAGPHYRSIVLRALPNLKKLDNKDVTPEEIQEAMRGGPTQREEEIYEDAQPQQQQPSPPQQQQQQQQQQEYYQQQQQQQQQQRRSQSPVKERTPPNQDYPTNEPAHPPSPKYNRDNRNSYHQYDEYYQSDYQRSAHPAHYRHSQTDLTEWDEQHQYNGHNQQRRSAGEDRYAYRNGNCPREREEWEDGDRPRNRRNEGRFSDTASVVSNAVLNHYAGYHRRPVNRNSNLLSATLCLVKELDYPSLEVVEHAVRCRIDELSAE